MPEPVGGARLVGRVYLERGEPVTVTTAWGPGARIRNVRIRRADGTTTVRPFRGLRRAGATLVSSNPGTQHRPNGHAMPDRSADHRPPPANVNPTARAAAFVAECVDLGLTAEQATTLGQKYFGWPAAPAPTADPAKG